jgi:superfamily II DNA or RNA helicase
LTYTRRVKSDDWAKKFEYIKTPLYSVDPVNNTAVVFGGMLSAIKTSLARSRIAYQVVDQRAPLPQPSYDRLQPLRKRQDTVIAAIVSSYIGIVECPTGWGKGFVITQLARIYPNLHILVTTPRKSVVGSLYTRIVDATADVGGKISKCSGSSKYLPESDVIVCTSGSLHKIDSDWPDLILFDEVHGAGSPKNCEVLPKFTNSRMIGFSASPKGRSDGSDKATQAFFGTPIVQITYQQAQEDKTVTPIEVRVVPVKNGPDDLPDTDNDIILKRQSYWDNYIRNGRIAQAAASFKDDEQVLILVQTVQHALRLKQFLPEFQVVYDTIGRERWAEFASEGLTPMATAEEMPYLELLYKSAREKKIIGEKVSPAQFILSSVASGELTTDAYKEMAELDADTIRDDFASCKIMKAIATPIWREGVDFVELYALIRADGMSSPIPSTQIPGRLSRVHDDKPSGVLVDFDDQFSIWAGRRAAKRIEHYRKHGWAMIYDWEPPAV